MQIKWTVWSAMFKLKIAWWMKFSMWWFIAVELMSSWWWFWWLMMVRKCFLRKALRWRDAYDLICCRQLANNRRWTTKLLPIKSATHCMSAWTIIVKFLPNNLWYWWILLTVCFKMSSICGPSSYFFFWAFSAAFVTLPVEISLKLTDFMTPTATVWRISRTAKRPSGGNSWKLSTHNGFVGIKFMIAASPDFIAFGFSSVVLPVRRSHFSLISANLHAMWAVWQSKTGVYPLAIWPGWFKTIT